MLNIATNTSFLLKKVYIRIKRRLQGSSSNHLPLYKLANDGIKFNSYLDLEERNELRVVLSGSSSH